MPADRSRYPDNRDHDPSNCDPDNLVALCAPCHLRADALHHARNARRTRARKRGQMFLPRLKWIGDEHAT